MARKVLYTRLHTTIHIPGTGELGSVLPPLAKTLDGLDMTMHDTHILVAFNHRGIKKEISIPFGNVAVMDLAPEEPKKAK